MRRRLTKVEKAYWTFIWGVAMYLVVSSFAKDLTNWMRYGTKVEWWVLAIGVAATYLWLKLWKKF
jgi:hypothetical protein